MDGQTGVNRPIRTDGNAISVMEHLLRSAQRGR